MIFGRGIYTGDKEPGYDRKFESTSKRSSDTVNDFTDFTKHIKAHVNVNIISVNLKISITNFI